MRSNAPWTDAEVAELNHWQNNPFTHPFTCGNDRTDKPHREYAAFRNVDFGQLIATREGWICPVCGYKQDWAHSWMLVGIGPPP